MHYNHCHRATTHLQLNIIIIFILFVLSERQLAKLPLLLNNATSKVHKVVVHEYICYLISVTCFVPLGDLWGC
jgi:hypothetical protein